MIIGYVLNDNSTVTQITINPEDGHTISNIIWIDLFQPTPKEEKWVSTYYSIKIPSMKEMDKIEVLSPFYKEKDAHYMTATTLEQARDHYCGGVALTFILTNSCLITLRYTESSVLKNCATYVIRHPELCALPEVTLISIVDGLINSIAEVLERAGNELDSLLRTLFENPDDKRAQHSGRHNEIMRGTGRTGNLISKNRESLVSINRLLIYFSQIDKEYGGKNDAKLRLRHLSMEIYSLNEYANFLSQRNAFLLDAVLGMIQVEQNMIIKMLTVGAAAFMPPTLISSMYGMNFHNMPGLDWELGYPLALLSIVISALVAYLIFKKKGWL